MVPEDVLCNIFRALKLSLDEKIAIMPLMERETGVTLGEIREYTRKRHSTFSLYERTLHKAEKEYKETHKVRPLTSGSSAFNTENKDQITTPHEGEGGRGRGTGPRRRQNRVLGAGALSGPKDAGGQGGGTNGKKEEENKHQGGPTPKCGLCKLQNRDPRGHWTEGCQWIGPDSKQTLKIGGTCLGCLRKKWVGGPPHLCPE